MSGSGPARETRARAAPAGSKPIAGAPTRHRTDPHTDPRAGFAPAVRRWQARHGRNELPWVGERDPYRVWLSEVMLQQTQVTTVLDYYRRFLERFPDVATLAAASREDVLALWSGLGYYSRARHLHECAQQVVGEHGGRFPSDSSALSQLPGIGRSTAAAIAAFAFGERAAILDGNVKRVLARALGFGADLASASAERALWAEAEALLPPRGIERYTQGLMDLGATVCLARQPACERCPLATRCVALAEQRVHHYPVKTQRGKRGRRESWVLWLAHRGRWWLTLRPGTGIWAGLWCLPVFDDRAALDQATRPWPGRATEGATVQHALTHFDWTLHPVLWTWPARAPSAAALQALQALQAREPQGTGRWFTPDEALAVGLPAPVRRLFQAAHRA